MKILKLISSGIISGVFFSLVFSQNLPAEEAPAVPAAPAKDAAGKGISQEALACIKAYSQYLSVQKSGKVEIKMDVKISTQGMKQEFDTDSLLSFERPNKVAYTVKSGLMASNLVCDGKKLFTYVKMLNKYTESDAPENLDGMNFATGNQGLPVVELVVAQNPEAAIMEGVNSAQVLGTEKINGQDCRHLHLEQEEFDWDLWIRAGDKPLLEKIVPDMNKMMKKIMEMQGLDQSGPNAEILKNMSYEIAVNFKNWELGVEIPQDSFKFVAPADAKKVDALFGGDEETDDQAEDDSQSADGLGVGAEAAKFSLETLDGGKFNLSDHIGKSVIVLDFWATWCPPCRKALPMLVSAVAKHKGAGVVFCAVNQGEKRDKIKAFLEKEKIDCTVALDSDSKVGETYGASSIPRTVLIGKDGKIAKIHVGFSDKLEKEISEEIGTLISEKASSK